MSSALRETPRLTVDEFLDFVEARPGERWELQEGVPRAMVGGTFAHAVISRNIVARLIEPARRRGCHALGGFLASIGTSSAYEPDALVLCGETVRTSRFTESPSIVFEVLSPSTMDFDRAVKARNYKRIESLQQLVFVYQDSVRVECWLRDEEGWSREPLILLDRKGNLALPTIGASLALSDIYEDVRPTPFED